jgi:5'-3' exonuclease
MGIPNYFSDLIKRHPDILSPLFSNNKLIDNFYLDSNSIIYDSIQFCDINNCNFEQQLSKEVISKLEEYLLDINANNIIIAFDGIAPMSKIQQQRERRYKTVLERKIKNGFDGKTVTWDTCNITAGTPFMKKLMADIIFHFKFRKNIQIFSSDDMGEGEHKIFSYIRDNQSLHHNKNTVIYGLDADLIMLCIEHIKYCGNLYLFRETPHFIRTIQKNLEPNESYLLDISCLIVEFKRCFGDNIVNDYIFICFLLGNDFLPHFPAINIRTNGIDFLFGTYKEVFGKSNSNNLTENNKINWKNVKRFLYELAKDERNIMCDEYKRRDRLERKKFSNKTVDDKMTLFNYIPVLNRDNEYIIDPFTDGWEERYYEQLLDIHPNKTNLEGLCTNYLEGLEWTYKYYVDSCYDWRWSYKYSYPPLLVDLIKYVPSYNVTMIGKKEINNILPITQLSLVLPQESYDIINLSAEMKDILKKMLYYKNVKHKWAFCKYFWESHIQFPYVDVVKLEQILHP